MRCFGQFYCSSSGPIVPAQYDRLSEQDLHELNLFDKLKAGIKINARKFAKCELF